MSTPEDIVQCPSPVLGTIATKRMTTCVSPVISLGAAANLALAIWPRVVLIPKKHYTITTGRTFYVQRLYPTGTARPAYFAPCCALTLLLVPGTPGASCSAVF